jgi:NAD(P)-dependent dehydrogenase (short-subunit alcohol dehydrogenase family)
VAQALQGSGFHLRGLTHSTPDSELTGGGAELPRGLRINAVAPGWVRETLLALKMDPAPGVPAVEVAQTYVNAVEGKITGQTLDVVKASS